MTWCEVLEIVAEFDDGDEVELADDFGNVMDGGVGTLDPSKFTDVPDGNVDDIVEF